MPSETNIYVNNARKFTAMIANLTNFNRHFVFLGTPYLKPNYKDLGINIPMAYKIEIFEMNSKLVVQSNLSLHTHNIEISC